MKTPSAMVLNEAIDAMVAVREHLAQCVFVNGRTRVEITTLNLASQGMVVRQLVQEGWHVRRLFLHAVCHLEIHCSR